MLIIFFFSKNQNQPEVVPACPSTITQLISSHLFLFFSSVFKFIRSQKVELLGLEKLKENSTEFKIRLLDRKYDFGEEFLSDADSVSKPHLRPPKLPPPLFPYVVNPGGNRFCHLPPFHRSSLSGRSFSFYCGQTCNSTIN